MPLCFFWFSTWWSMACTGGIFLGERAVLRWVRRLPCDLVLLATKSSAVSFRLCCDRYSADHDTLSLIVRRIMHGRSQCQPIAGTFIIAPGLRFYAGSGNEHAGRYFLHLRRHRFCRNKSPVFGGNDGSRPF